MEKIYYHSLLHFINFKIATLARGETWTPDSAAFEGFPTSCNESYIKGSAPSYQNYTSADLKIQTESFFSRVQRENITRPESVIIKSFNS